MPKEGIIPEKVTARIKELAKNIREISTTARDTVKKFHESGAITELGEAVQEAAAAGRDTTREIRDTAEEVRDSRVAADTARAIEETAKTAGQTIQVAEDTARQVPLAAPPKTTSTARKGVVEAYVATRRSSRPVKSKLKKGTAKKRTEATKLSRKTTKKLTEQKKATARSIGRILKKSAKKK